MSSKFIPNAILAGLLFTPVSAFAIGSEFIEPPMVSIPAGEFYMGSDRGREDEKPVHKVSVPAFQMGKYEVTLAEFRKFVEATGYKTSDTCTHRIGERWFGTGPRDGSWDNNIYSGSEYYPVVCVSRTDAVNYAKWLSEKSGKHYRLPTEAEWEYTVRAGTNTRYFYGDELDSSKACQFANLSDYHAKAQTPVLHNADYSGYTIQPCSDKEVIISTVGLYEPNPFGVYDMLGNVVERLEDCYQESYVGAPVDGSAVTKESCDTYVARGGSWHWDAFRSSQRMRMSEDFLAALEGFRLALDTAGKSLPSSPGNSEFVASLKVAQNKARSAHSKISDYPSKPQGLQITSINDKRVTLKWLPSEEPFVTGYRVYRQDPASNQTVVLANDIKKNRFADNAPLSTNARYTVVALNGNLESPATDAVDSTINMVHTLPHKIQGEAFSLAPGAEVRYSSMEPEDDKIINALGKHKATYQLKVDKKGRFTVKARVFHSGKTQQFDLWLGDKKLAAPTLQGERGWKTIEGLVLDLPAGIHALSVTGHEPLFAINWLDVNPSPLN